MHTYTSEERAALLTRLRDNLLRQRERFEEYLLVLDAQEEAISEGDPELLNHYVQLESRIIAEIDSVQKVVAPLSEIYRAVTPEPDPEILDLKESLGRLHQEATKRNIKNQELLRSGMEGVREEISAVRRPQRTTNVYSSRGTGTLLDITT
mgnify:CR=1 FL=1